MKKKATMTTPTRKKRKLMRRMRKRVTAKLEMQRPQ